MRVKIFGLLLFMNNFSDIGQVFKNKDIKK